MYALALFAVVATVIHGNKAVAQLKPGTQLIECLRALSHPRQQSRGPIEALRKPGLDIGKSNVIHGNKAVAQLKQIAEDMAREWIAVIHGNKAVAQLKPVRAQPRSFPCRPSSTATKPWPN